MELLVALGESRTMSGGIKNGKTSSIYGAFLGQAFHVLVVYCTM
jgi:hypothetical protein